MVYSYACNVCSHVSRSKDALRKHVSYRHPGAPSPCESEAKRKRTKAAAAAQIKQEFPSTSQQYSQMALHQQLQQSNQCPFPIDQSLYTPPLPQTAHQQKPPSQNVPQSTSDVQQHMEISQIKSECTSIPSTTTTTGGSTSASSSASSTNDNHNHSPDQIPQCNNNNNN